MGCFDTISIVCPVCGYQKNKIQSKAGPCNLNNYTRWNAPQKVLIDIANEPIYCYKCDTCFILKTQVSSDIKITKKRGKNENDPR